MEASAAAPRHGVQVIALVSVEHFVSHFYQLALPPLFPVLKGVYGVSYTELGLLVSVLFIASGIGQAAAGFVVDRFGARDLLIGGLALLSASFLLLGVFPSYGAAVVLVFFAGLGNSVFHPANFAIFSGSVAKGAQGRAYSLHTLSGHLGYALAPATMIGLSTLWDWQSAVFIAGAAGLATVALLVLHRRILLDDTGANVDRPINRAPLLGDNIRLLLSQPVVACLVFFVVLATAMIGLQTYAVVVLTAHYGFPLGVAGGLLTVWLVGVMLGVLPGGLVADRTERHDLGVAVAFTGVAVALCLVALLGGRIWVVGVAFAVGGFLFGAALPVRDMIVRKVTPEGATGKVFGVVYSGLDIGSALAPFAFGWLIDFGRPGWMLPAIALCMLATAASALVPGGRAPPRPVSR